MTRLFRRTKRARDASSEPEQPALSEPFAAHDHAAHTGADYAIPAGLELDHLVGEAPATRSRSKLRRRLRHLRKVRELLLRDLGGLVLEIHRSGLEPRSEAQDRLVKRKLNRLAQADAEIAELEQILSDRRPSVVREPGIGGACLNCGELYGSNARFCWACGTAVAPGHGRRAVAPPATAGYAQLAAPAPRPHPYPRPQDWIDSDAQALGEQHTEVMHPHDPDPPTQVLPPDGEAPKPEQPTEPFEPAVDEAHDAAAQPEPAAPPPEPAAAVTPAEPEPEPAAAPPEHETAAAPPAAEPIAAIRQTASFQAPKPPLPPPSGPSQVDLPIPPGVKKPEPHPADSLWNDAPPAPENAPPELSSGDPLAARSEPDAP